MATDNQYIAIAEPLAAELTVLHRADPNQLQNIMQHIVTDNPTIEELRRWLEALVEYAEFFPRSEQTLKHNLAAGALVSHLIDEEYITNLDAVARIIGWTVRLMRYYRNSQREAEHLIDRRNPRLHVPKARYIQLRHRPPRRIAQDEIPDVRDDPSDFAKRFMSFLGDRDDE